MIQGNDSFRLVVRRGPQPNQVYELNKDIVTLGRDNTNDNTNNDPEVSSHHMRLTRGAGGFTLEDLGSTNGTFVNGQRLTGARPLRDGDMIGLGETVTLGYESGAGVQPGYAPVDPGLPMTAPARSAMPNAMTPRATSATPDDPSSCRYGQSSTERMESNSIEPAAARTANPASATASIGSARDSSQRERLPSSDQASDVVRSSSSRATTGTPSKRPTTGPMNARASRTIWASPPEIPQYSCIASSHARVA